MHDLTLADYRKNVLGLVQDSEYDTTLVDQAINWFVFELHNNSRIRYMEESDTLAPSALATTVDFPDDFQTLISLYLTVPQVINLMPNRMSYNDFMASHANFKTSSSAQISQWTDYGNGMRFAAPAKTASKIAIDYLRRAARMESDDDTCEVPDAYEELVSKGALARLMEINEDYEEAANERDNLKPLVTAFIRNEGRGQIAVGPNVMGQGRARRRGWNSAQDF